MDSRKRFGSRLKEARERKGWSQNKLATMLGEGVRQNHISKYEAGNAMPRPERVIYLSSILDVSEGWLRGFYADDESEDSLDLSEDVASSTSIAESAELVWRRKELEAQRENLELRKQLLAQEGLFGHLSHILNEHLNTLNLLLDKLEVEQKKQFEELRESLVEKIDAAASEPLTGSHELRSSLQRMENIFRPGSAEMQLR